MAFPIFPSLKHGSHTLLLYWYFWTFMYVKWISIQPNIIQYIYSVIVPFWSWMNKIWCFSLFHKMWFLFQNLLLNHRKLLSQAQRSRLIMCLLRIGDKEQFHVGDSSQLKKLFCYIVPPRTLVSSLAVQYVILKS